MTVTRRSVEDGKEVIAYSHDDAWNLAARAIANPKDDFGTFASPGVIVGMSVANERFNKPPDEPEVDDQVAFGCMAQAADDIKRQYEKIKAECIAQELRLGQEWAQGKQDMIQKLLTAGAEIQNEISGYLRNVTESAIDGIEKLMTQDIGKKSEAEDTDDGNPEEE
ncbi:MAG: hypothetical protein MZV49_24075 [Rhodopseudomonas palustris]|nr:hypothetical protein [Rhodopseudomonas palustris]